LAQSPQILSGSMPLRLICGVSWLAWHCSGHSLAHSSSSPSGPRMSASTWSGAVGRCLHRVLHIRSPLSRPCYGAEHDLRGHGPGSGLTRDSQPLWHGGWACGLVHLLATAVDARCGSVQVCVCVCDGVCVRVCACVFSELKRQCSGAAGELSDEVECITTAAACPQTASTPS